MLTHRMVALLAAALAVAACSDRNPTAAGPAPSPPLQKYECTGSVRELRVSCDQVAAAGVRASIYGGQNVNVRLTSTNVKYDSAARIFTADLAMKNLSRQAMGSADGVHADSGGIRLFFSAGPYVTAGFGAVWVSNADGYDAITAGDQPYFRYPGILRPDSVTAARTWKWHVDPTVNWFGFTLLVDAQVTPAVVISEIMAHPSTSPEEYGEWFEIYNAGFLPVDLDGWTIASGGDAGHTIGQHVVVQPRGYAVLGRSTDESANGEAGVAYAYGGIDLANGTDDWLALRTPAGFAADSVSWGAAEGETAGPPPLGISLMLDPLDANNLHLGGETSPWQPSKGRFGTGQQGSPGTRNVPALAATAIAAGFGHTCVLDLDGQGWCWGLNNRGQLGIGTLTGQPETPVPGPNWARPMIQPGLHFTHLATSTYQTCAAEYLGGIYCAGWNMESGAQPTPDLLLDVAVASLWGGWQICGVTPGEQAYCVGFFGNWFSTTFAPAPQPVPHVIATTSGGGFVCELDSTGQAYCAGNNQFGQLGDSTGISRDTFVAVHQPAGVRFTVISAGGDYACALADSGQAYCWGEGTHGQIGGWGGLAPGPVAQPSGVKFTAIATSGELAAAEHTCALAADGRVYCWGSNGYGELGDGTTALRPYPTLVLAPPGITFSAIAVGYRHTCALAKPDGQPYCWGDNEYGQLGDGTYSNRSRPVPAGR
jgi:lamin tail-like protein/regulator of chromosome condensation (RCC1) repeat-containing protein/Regulator of Chromosome Condensation (RCC1) repeat protein